MTQFAVLDIESTGLDPFKDKIIEIGIVFIIDGEIQEEYHSLINPEMEINHHIHALTKITNVDLKKAPLFKEIAASLKKKLEGKVLVAHNAVFDYSFIVNEWHRLGERVDFPILCSLKLARKVFPSLKQHSLAYLTKSLLNQPEPPHRALEDARYTAHIFQKILDHYLREKSLTELLHCQDEALFPAFITWNKLSRLSEGAGKIIFEDKAGNILIERLVDNLRKSAIDLLKVDLRNKEDFDLIAKTRKHRFLTNL